jgi:HK97 family phage major capsid protein/HK97 family phage prohead protease
LDELLEVKGMTDRAYAVLELKAVEEEGGKRIFTGIATTPATDRYEDIVEPKGAVFKLPIPLLWQHDSRQPIGWVTAAKVSNSGIEITGEIADVPEEGGLKDRLKEAWQSIKHKLVRGLSIGFDPIESSHIEGTYGYRFLKWEWLELSVVTIAANAEASIQSIKSADRLLRAASGQKKHVVARISPPGDSGKKDSAGTRLTPRNAKDGDMNIQDQIKSFQDARKAKFAKMQDLMEASAKTGETLTAEASEEYETLEGEIKALDVHLKRLESMEKVNIESAKPIVSVQNGNAAEVRSGAHVVVSKPQQAKDGLAMAQVVKFLGRAQGQPFVACEMAKADPNVDPRAVAVLKTAVAAGSTTNTTWAGNLVGEETSVYADFIEYLRPQTILGRFGTGGIPSLRRVPFRVPLIGQTSGGEGYWVGEGAPKPLTKFDFSRVVLEPLKVANVAVLTMEVLRDSSPSADIIVRDQLVAALRSRLDTDFVDPLKTASAGVSPASITNGITPIASSGDDAEAVRADIKALFSAFIADNNAPTTGVWVMPATVALALSLMQNPLGQSEFPGINMMGGTLFGLPVIVSEFVPTVSAGAYVILMNATDVYIADNGGFTVDMSREASLQMDDSPTNNSVTPTATQLVSLWQTNSVGFRAEREINWARRRTGAVQILSGVNWGSGS